MGYSVHTADSGLEAADGADDDAVRTAEREFRPRQDHEERWLARANLIDASGDLEKVLRGLYLLLAIASPKMTKPRRNMAYYTMISWAQQADSAIWPVFTPSFGQFLLRRLANSNSVV